MILNTRSARSKFTLEIAMKSKLIMMCACLGVLGSTSAYAGDEEAMIDVAESAASPSESGETKDSEAKDHGRNDGPSGKSENSKAGDDQEDSRGKKKQLTNADCLPPSIPASAHPTAKACIGLSNGHPDMPFTPADYKGMPVECQPYVYPKCQ
jgi:hypothetical protein